MKTGSLKREFFSAVTVTLLIVAAASALTVWGCTLLRKRLVPDTNYVMLHVSYSRSGVWEQAGSIRLEVDGQENRINFLNSSQGGITGREPYDFNEVSLSVSSVDYGIGRNGPRRKIAYIATGAAMGALPAAYAVAGTLLCALWFYRNRLEPAITALDDATLHIREHDLDFTVSCGLQNELGRLCGSFEEMRLALVDNNLKLWRTIEERRMIQASVAHDLRNPLAIMEGLVENLREVALMGELTQERLDKSLAELAAAAERMERYTDYIRDLDAIGETEVEMTEVSATGFLREAASSMEVLARSHEVRVAASFDVPECRIELDREIFYRILENVFSNAVRYAKSVVELQFTLQGDTLCVRVSDDGRGFSPRMLKKKDSLCYSEDPTGGHMGLGLATSRILCEKHGGRMMLTNRPEGGAAVELQITIKRI